MCYAYFKVNEGSGKMAFSENLKRIRKSKGMSQADLAKKANLSEVSVRKYESGERNPKLETRILLANALSVPFDELNGGPWVEKKDGNMFFYNEHHYPKSQYDSDYKIKPQNFESSVFLSAKELLIKYRKALGIYEEALKSAVLELDRLRGEMANIEKTIDLLENEKRVIQNEIMLLEADMKTSSQTNTEPMPDKREME